MKCSIVLDDWRKVGSPNTIYNTPLGFKLSEGDLHAGTVFEAEVDIADKSVEKEIVKALREHSAYPVFRVIVKGEENG